MCALMLTACASCPQPLAPKPPPANLRTPCPDLVAPADGTGATLLPWSIATVMQYRECQSRHRRLLEAWPKE